MYVTSGALFFVGLGLGITVTLLAIVGIALYLDNKNKRG